MWDKKTYAYDFQKSLIPKRIGQRNDKYQSGRSFVEDRSPVEDQSIFWRRLQEQGYLSKEQMDELIQSAKTAYAPAPKSDVMIKLLRSPRECRKMILKRGRPAEIKAWSRAELEAMEVFYKGLFEDMDKYGSHQGPKMELDLQEWDAKNTTHWGFLFQEILHGLLEWEERKH
ncbi:TPA: deoxynucleoside kinase [Candidatus Woesearchaeota archaeon]|nr:deoxynucleoside kinase [Candidatus Woesearchaeota archaeon]